MQGAEIHLLLGPKKKAIQGDSQARSHEKSIDIDDWSFGLAVKEDLSKAKTAGNAQGSGNQADVSDIELHKAIDRSSPALMQLVASGDELTEATLHMIHRVHLNVRVSLRLTDVRLTDYSIAVAGDGALVSLKETIRLSSHLAEVELPADDLVAPPPHAARVDPSPQPETRDEILRRARELEVEVEALQARLASALRESGEGVTFAPSEYLGYRRVIEDVHGSVEDTVPAGATVLVVSRGDEELLDLGGRRAWHFPRQADGRYLGHYPADGVAAVRHLEELRGMGASYLVVPSTAYWWLEHYSEFGRHLRERYAAVSGRQEACVIFSLGGG